MQIPLRGSGPMLVVAHRGASAVAPENTLPAVRAALAADVTWVEVDVQPTADGVPVVVHDDDLDRTTTGAGPVHAATAAVVATLDAGSWFGPDFAGTAVPELTAVLDTLGDTGRLLLEVKGPHTDEELATVVRTVAGHPAGDRVALQSFEEAVLRRLGSRPYGLLRENLDTDPVATAQELGAVSYHPQVSALLAWPAVVPALHAVGLAVAVWTADTAAEWAALDDLGVDAVITNHPVVCRDFLRRRAG